MARKGVLKASFELPDGATAGVLDVVESVAGARILEGRKIVLLVPLSLVAQTRQLLIDADINFISPKDIAAVKASSSEKCLDHMEGGPTGFTRDQMLAEGILPSAIGNAEELLMTMPEDEAFAG